MTENKRFTVKQRQGATNYSISDYYGQLPLSEGIYYKSNADKLCKWLNEQHELLNALYHENEELKNKIDVLEDDNETYYKSLEKLNLYTKRFIPTKCTNEFKDCKTNRYYWLDHEGNFEGCLELLNLLDCENEELKFENRHLKGRLMEYEEQIKR